MAEQQQQPQPFSPQNPTTPTESSATRVAAGGEVASASASSSDITAQSASTNAPADASSDLTSGSDHAAIDELLKQANFEDPSNLAADGGATAPDAAPFDLPNFQQVIADAQVSSIDLLRDVELNVKIELGRSRMFVEDVLKLGEGSVVELDKLAGDPVDVFVNDRLVARGEVLVLNDNFCVRVNEIVAGVKEEGV